MKPMKDKRMDMKGGPVDSEAFFPEKAEHRKLPRAGEIKGSKYPDTDEQIHSEQDGAVRSAQRAAPKPSFRH